MRRVDLTNATNPAVQALVDHVHAAGIEVVVVDCTVDTEVPTFCAYLCDTGNPLMGLYNGYGTHLDPQVAVIRAICEAAQGRLVFIAGSRDDSFGHHRRFQSTFQDANTALLELPMTVGIGSFADTSQDTFEGDGAVLLERLANVGIDRVLAHDMTHPDVGIDVVRVVAPGLEGYMLEDFSPGLRARAWAAGHQQEVGTS